MNSIIGQELQDSFVYKYSKIFSDGSENVFEYFIVNNQDTPLYKEIRYQNGKIKSEGYVTQIDTSLLVGKHIEKKFYIGTYKEFHDNGSLEFVCWYNKNNKKEGVLKSYYKNGQIRMITNALNGVIVGDFCSYHPNGQILEKGMFKMLTLDGEIISSRDGYSVQYYKNGQKEYEGNYWFEEIIMFSEEDCLNYPIKMENFLYCPPYWTDLKHEQWKYWNKKGDLLKIEIYEKGKLLKTILGEE